MENKKLVIAVIIIVVVVMIGSIINISVSLNRPTEDVVTSSFFKDGFIKGCIENGTYDGCSCAYDKLEEKFGKDGFMKMAVKYQTTNILPDGVMDAVNDCISKF